MSDSLRPHELQHARTPCPLPTPGDHPNPCPSSRWCHPAISSSLVPFSSYPQSFSGSSRIFSNESALASDGQSIEVSVQISSSNEHPGPFSFRMDWLDRVAVQGTLKSLLQHHSSRPSIFRRLAFFIIQLSHPYMTTGKTIAFTIWTFVGKVMSLLLNMLSRLVIAFLPRSKRLLISWLQSPSAVIWRWSLSFLCLFLERYTDTCFLISFSFFYRNGLYVFFHSFLLNAHNSLFPYSSNILTQAVITPGLTIALVF